MALISRTAHEQHCIAQPRLRVSTESLLKPYPIRVGLITQQLLYKEQEWKNLRPHTESIKRVFPRFRKPQAEMFFRGVCFTCVVEHITTSFSEPFDSHCTGQATSNRGIGIISSLAFRSSFLIIPPRSNWRANLLASTSVLDMVDGRCYLRVRMFLPKFLVFDGGYGVTFLRHAAVQLAPMEIRGRLEFPFTFLVPIWYRQILTQIPSENLRLATGNSSCWLSW